MSKLKKTTLTVNKDGTVTLAHVDGLTLTGKPIVLLEAYSGRIMAAYNRQIAKKMDALEGKVNDAFDMFRALPNPPSIKEASPVIAAQLGIDAKLVIEILSATWDDGEDDEDDDGEDESDE